MPAQQGVSCVLPSAPEQLRHNGSALHVSVSSSAYVAAWIQIWGLSFWWKIKGVITTVAASRSRWDKTDVMAGTLWLLCCCLQRTATVMLAWESRGNHLGLAPLVHSSSSSTMFCVDKAEIFAARDLKHKKKAGKVILTLEQRCTILENTLIKGQPAC